MRLLSILAVAWVAWLSGTTNCLAAEAGEPTSAEKLLFGFEPAHIEPLADQLQAKLNQSQDVEGRPYIRVDMGRGRIARQWSIYEGNATEGKFAAGLGLTRWPDGPMPGLYAEKKTAPFENRDVVMHYFGMFADGDWQRMFNSAGIHHVFLPADWSQYDLLRLDVYCRHLSLEYRVAIEDEDILPPVVRAMEVPAGKWYTLEVDLRAAASARGLDPRKIVSLAVAVTRIIEGELDKTLDPRSRREQRFALVDNIRLCRRDAPARFPVIRDPSGYELLAGYYRSEIGRAHV